MGEQKVLMAKSIWNNSGTSDKVYSLQLVEESDGTYSCYAQWGRRERYTSEQIKKDHVARWEAESEFNNFLNKKRKRGYDKEISPIIPKVFGGTGTTALSKEKQKEQAAMLEGLQDFLKPNPDLVVVSGLDTLFSNYGKA